MMPGASACGDSELSLSLSLCTNHQSEQPKLELASQSHPSMHTGKNLRTQEDEESFTHVDDYGNKRQRGPISVPQWQRVKWTNAMVNLLIMVATYLSEGANFVGVGAKKIFKIKWKSVSNVMIEKGLFVSSHQCKDKFNELNKRYMRLNHFLGREVAIEVVENPEKLDSMMGNLSDKIKEQVRKILGSKHLFYKEMCSYHNNDKLRLSLLLPHPHDIIGVEKSLKSNNVRGSDDTDYSDSSLDLNEDEDDDEDDFEEYEEEFRNYSCIGDPIKKMKRGPDLENFSVGSKSTNNNNICNGFQMEEMNLKLEIETLEMERQWRIALENEMMKMENKRIALELKRMKMRMNNANN